MLNKKSKYSYYSACLALIKVLPPSTSQINHPVNSQQCFDSHYITDNYKLSAVEFKPLFVWERLAKPA